MKPPIGLDLGNPDAVRAWIKGLASAADDLAGIARDQMRPLASRDLGRREAKRIAREAYASLTEALAYAAAGLPPDDDAAPDSGDPAGSGGSPVH